MGRAFTNTELHLSGRLCMCSLTGRDFDECGAEKEDTEHLVNELLSIKDVLIAVLLVEEERAPKQALELENQWMLEKLPKYGMVEDI